jgi:hypothetical protein
MGSSNTALFDRSLDDFIALKKQLPSAVTERTLRPNKSNCSFKLAISTTFFSFWRGLLLILIVNAAAKLSLSLPLALALSLLHFAIFIFLKRERGGTAASG